MAIRNPVTGADPLPGFRVRALRRAPRNDQFVYYHAGLATTGLAPCFEIGATPKKAAPCHLPTAQIFLLRAFSNFTLRMMVSKLPVLISLMTAARSTLPTRSIACCRTCRLAEVIGLAQLSGSRPMISLWCWMYHLIPGSDASEPPMPMIPSAPAANLP